MADFGPFANSEAAGPFVEAHAQSFRLDPHMVLMMSFGYVPIMTLTTSGKKSDFNSVGHFFAYPLLAAKVATALPKTVLGPIKAVNSDHYKQANQKEQIWKQLDRHLCTMADEVEKIEKEKEGTG